MKIQARVTTYKTTEIEVDFPLFIHYGDVFDGGGGYDTWVRYESDGTYHSITENYEGKWDYEHSETKNPEQLRRNLGYHIVEQGHGTCPPEEFYEKLDEFISLLREIPR